MKKKLLVLVAMLLCVVTVLASCASSMKFEKIVGDGTYNDENPTLTTAAKVDVKGTKYAAAGDLVLFKDTVADASTYTVYNLATGATVFTCAESKPEIVVGQAYTHVEYNVMVEEQWDTALISVMTRTTTATVVDGDFEYDYKLDVKMLTATGTEILSMTDVTTADITGGWSVADLFCVDGKVYRIADDGTVAHAFDWSDLRGEPEIEEKVGEFYLGETYANGVAVYDASLNLITTYHMPSYAGSRASYELANGNVLVQYTVEEELMSEDYDYVQNGTKYSLYSFLIDAAKGKVKELDLDYKVTYVSYNKGDMENWPLDERVENVAFILEIEDERLDTEETAYKLVSLGNNGKIDGMMDEIIPDLLPEGLMQVATNRWIAMNWVGQTFLLNEKGDVIGEITGVDLDAATPDFFVLNNKVYDWDLNVKVDLDEHKIEGDCKVMNHSVLFGTEDDEVKLYVNGEVKTIIDKATAEAGKREVEILSDALYVIVDTATAGTVKYELYNDLGTLLTTVDNATFTTSCIVYTADSTNAVLIAGTDAELKTVYYRVA